MHFTNFVRIFCGTTVVAVFVLVSNSALIPARAASTPSGQPQLNATRMQTRSLGSLDSETRSTGDVVVSAAQGIYVYSSTLKPVTQINNLPGQPAGLALDTAGDLYVANYGTTIPIYKNDYKTLIATLSAPDGSQGVAVAGNGVVGTVIGTQVTFYASGSTTPCASLSVPSVQQVYQGAFDAAGNFYVTGQSGSPNYDGFVGVIHGGCSATEFTLLSTSNALGKYVYGIQVTRYGKIAVGSESNRAIYTYNPPIDGALGQPISTTVLPATTSAIYEFGFTAKGAFVFVSENAGIIAKYAYPAGGELLQSVGQRQQLYNPTGLVVADPQP